MDKDSATITKSLSGPGNRMPLTGFDPVESGVCPEVDALGHNLQNYIKLGPLSPVPLGLPETILPSKYGLPHGLSMPQAGTGFPLIRMYCLDSSIWWTLILQTQLLCQMLATSTQPQTLACPCAVKVGSCTTDDSGSKAQSTRV